MYKKGTQLELASALGVSRQTIHRKLKKVAPEIKFPVTEELFDKVLYAINNDIEISKVESHKNNNIERRKEEIKKDIGLAESQRSEAIVLFIDELGTDISEEAKTKVIENLKADYKFYSGLITTYKFLIDKTMQELDKNGKPKTDETNEKNLANAQKNLQAIIKQLESLGAFKGEKPKKAEFSFTPKGAK